MVKVTIKQLYVSCGTATAITSTGTHIIHVAHGVACASSNSLVTKKGEIQSI